MNLEEVRNKIDRVDIELLNRLHLRTELALLAKRLKGGYVVDEEREKQVLENVKRTSRRLVDSSFSERLYLQIIEESRRIQTQEHRLAGFQGEHGAFSEQALEAFNPELVPIPCLEFMDVFSGVENGFFDYGIVPVENSLEGGIHEVNHILTETELKIVGEILFPIHHCLLAPPEMNYHEIRAVYSHPQALAQCRSFLARHKFEAKPYYDTAGAARWLAAEKPHGAAVIAGRLASELYGLEIIKENIEDHPGNKTRFVVLSAEALEEKGNKCSITFTTPHKAGALSGILNVFAGAGINLTRVESKPVRDNPEMWTFLLDFQGRDDDERVVGVLDNVREKTSSFRLLGCYPEGKK